MNNLKHFVLMSVKQGSKLDMSSAGHLLGIAEEGFFASTAWLKGDEEYNKVSGSSFGITTGDDDMFYKESKFKMSRPTEEQVKFLLLKCDTNFIKRAKKLIE